MKGLTYEMLVTHYGLSVCNSENGCVYSPSAHSRGIISHWRGDVMHWNMNRGVTRPGLLTFLRAIARDNIKTAIALGGKPRGSWMLEMAEVCMWAQREAQQQWKVVIPKSAFKREKTYVREYHYLPRIKKGEMTPDDYTTPLYMWATTQDEEKK